MLFRSHSQLARVIYENGIIGTWLFIRVFTKPVELMTDRLPPNLRREFMLMVLLVLGCSLGHRSSAMFIYLGIVIATFHVLRQDKPESR